MNVRERKGASFIPHYFVVTGRLSPLRVSLQFKSLLRCFRTPQSATYCETRDGNQREPRVRASCPTTLYLQFHVALANRHDTRLRSLARGGGRLIAKNRGIKGRRREEGWGEGRGGRGER